jgi:hypothetical protein
MLCQREFEKSGLPLEFQETDYQKPADLLWYRLRPEQRQERALGHIKVMFANHSATF